MPSPGSSTQEPTISNLAHLATPTLDSPDLRASNARDYRVTWLSTFLFFVAYYALIVPLPRYLTSIGLADWQVGLILGTAGVASLLIRPVSGILTDQIGYKPVLLFGAASFTLGAVGTIFTTAVPLLITLRILQALGYVTFTTAGNALVGKLSAPEERSAKIAYFGLAANFAMTMTPGMTDLVLPYIGLSPLFWLAGTLSIMAGLLTRLLHLAPITQPSGESRATFSASLWRFPRHLWLAMGMAALFGAGFGAYFQYFAILLERREIAAAPIYATYGLSIIATRLLLGRYLARIGLGRVLTVAAALMVAGLVVAAYGTSIVALAVAAALIATGGGFFHPMLIAHHVNLLPERPGWAVACFYFGFDAGIGLGGWLLGAVLDFAGLTALFMVAALLTLLTLPLIPPLLRQQPPAHP